MHILHNIFIFSLGIVFMIGVIYKLLCLSCSATLHEAYLNWISISWIPKPITGCGDSRS